MPWKIPAVVTISLLPFWLEAQQSPPVRESPAQSARIRAAEGPPLRETLSQSSQMVVVTTKDWTATEGLLRRFERKERDWQQVGPSAGVGWGRVLPNFPASSVPHKREGAGRSPAGIFRLTYAFGYAPPDKVREIKLPYIQCTETVECVDDTNSSYYNIIKARPTAEKVDWKSSEKMLMSDDEYNLGIFFEQTTAPPTPGA